MHDTRDTQRVVIELPYGDGPMTGRFMCEGDTEPTPFAGWVELLALLESARADPRGPGRAKRAGLEPVR